MVHNAINWSTFTKESKKREKSGEYVLKKKDEEESENKAEIVSILLAIFISISLIFHLYIFFIKCFGSISGINEPQTFFSFFP